MRQTIDQLSEAKLKIEEQLSNEVLSKDEMVGIRQTIEKLERQMSD